MIWAKQETDLLINNFHKRRMKDLMELFPNKTLKQIKYKAHNLKLSSYNKNQLQDYEFIFWSLVEKKDQNQCWIWQGVVSFNGYGRFTTKVNKKVKQHLAHRLAYHFYHDNFDQNKMVRHRCDNKLCCNPHHLELGTQQDNMNDMVLRQRSVGGIKNPASKFTEEQIKTIRREFKFKTIQKLSEEYEVLRDTISNIVNYKSYKHIGR